MECYKKYLFILAHYKEFREIRKPVLVATNIFRNDMNIEGIYIVFNYDMPEDTDTYLHRVWSKASDFSLLTYLILDRLCWWT